MTTDEAQANMDTMIGIMFVFGIPTRVLFYSGSSKSFVNSSFALHAHLKLASLKNNLVVTTPLGEQILRNTVFKGCEVFDRMSLFKSKLDSIRDA